MKKTIVVPTKDVKKRVMKKSITKTVRREVRRYIVKEVIENVNNLRLTSNITDQLNNIEYEKETQTFELIKLKKEYELLKKRNTGLQKIEEHFFNGSSKVPYNSATKVLKQEIKRLMEIVTSQAEIISKEPILTSSVSSLQRPRLIRSHNPITLAKNFLNFQKDLKEYEQSILNSKNSDLHLTLETNGEEIQVSKATDKSYKSEHIKEHDTYLQVGDKIRRFVKYPFL